MSREKPGYRDILADLHRQYPDVDMLTPAQVAEVTGMTVQTVRRKFAFNRLTRQVAMADLARQISAG